MVHIATRARPLRVGLLAPPALAVPPSGYGGVEAVVNALFEALETLGVRVAVAAAGTVPGSFERPVGLQLPPAEALGADLVHGARSIAHLAGMDLIHDHTKAAGTALARLSPVPVVTTVHNDATPARRAVYRACAPHPFVFLSKAQAERYRGIAAFEVVPNGIDLRSAPFRARKEDYLLFLGRFSRVKGPHEAIALARLTGVPLVLAGCVDPADRRFFEEEVAPHVDGSQIRLACDVAGQAKWSLLSGARALVAPVLWEEPFGLVLIEAMACGTPVLAYRRGAVPEIVVHGRTGYLARDRRELALACERLGSLAPVACRRHVAERFSARAMAEGYLAVYERLLAMRARKVAGQPESLRPSSPCGGFDGPASDVRAAGGCRKEAVHE